MSLKLKGYLITKTLIGLIVGAALSTIIAMAILSLYTGVTTLVFDLSAFNGIFSLTLMVLVFTLPTGLIAHAILSALKLRDWYIYCGLAWAAGGAAGQLLISDTDFSARLVAFGGYGGWAALCALITWLIRRPDKDAAPVPVEQHF